MAVILYSKILINMEKREFQTLEIWNSFDSNVTYFTVTYSGLYIKPSFSVIYENYKMHVFHFLSNQASSLVLKVL